MQLRCTALTAEELAGPEYALVAEMTHQKMLDFVIEYFLRRTSWLTRLHHALSIATFVAILIAAWMTGRSFLAALGDFALAFLALFLVILPLHELLHALAYRLVGARDIRWDYSLRMAAVWVIAHRFVATTRPFIIVALAPFVVLNAALIVGAIAFPRLAVFLLWLLLWHLHGAIGDWSLLNFIWLHRERGFWTYDDAATGRSYFYGRV